MLVEQAKEKEERIAYLKEEIKRSKGLDNPIVRQLREHFKALREQLGEMMYEEEGDDVDIDNMTYEVFLPSFRNCSNWKRRSAPSLKASPRTNSKNWIASNTKMIWGFKRSISTLIKLFHLPRRIRSRPPLRASRLHALLPLRLRAHVVRPTEGLPQLQRRNQLICLASLHIFPLLHFSCDYISLADNNSSLVIM
jgi:hypothetical protein